jgi:uncharacterized protein YecT (DUF1311 family)
VRRVALAVVAMAMLAAPALAQGDKPDAKASAAIQRCIKSAGPHTDKREACIGRIAEPCLKRKTSRSTADINACITREQKVWNDILNNIYKRLNAKLDDQQQVKLRDMQRAWIVSRDKTCTFYWDYFQGSMAAPMSIGCENRETGRRALFLLGFLEDAEGK